MKITNLEYEEYQKLKKYRDIVFHEFGEIKEKVLLLKILSEVNYSAVSKEDIANLIYDNIDSLFHSAVAYNDLLTHYLIMKSKL